MGKSIVLFLFLYSLVVTSVFIVHPANALSDEWVEKSPMPTGRYNFCAAVVNGTIYAIGGITNIPERKQGHITTTVNVNEAYDPATNVWVEKAPMPSPHWLDSYGIAVYQNKIYCIGGPANNIYDPATDTWEAKTPMPTPRHFLTASVVEDKIYLIGGLALGPAPAWQAALTNDPRMTLITYSSSSLTEVYDPIMDSWTEKAPIPNAVDSYASVVIDNKIYVIGGRIGGNVVGLVQVYDTQNDKWSQATPIPTPVEEAAAGVITVGKTKTIYVVGGRTALDECNGTTLNQVYFPENASWTADAPIIANRFALSVAVTNEELYAIGGMGDHGFTATTYQYTPANPIETNLTTSSKESSPSNEKQNNLPFTTELSTLFWATIAISAIAVRWKKKPKTVMHFKSSL
jgi:hypothetical protein